MIAMRNAIPLLLIAALLPVATSGQAQVDARMFRYPDVSQSHIAFVFAGDIWVVEKEGGLAMRLSSPRGEELFPRFSPDGSRIAFSANYDGNTDVYVVPALGGEPTRVTYHPGTDRLVDWSPDGRLLFASARRSGVTRFSQLYLIPAAGGMPEQTPVPYGEFAALSPDGRRLAFTTKARGFRTWKRYRGGLAPDIWLFDLETLDATNITEHEANDELPMWYEGTIYFLSDRGPERRYNIWAYEIEGADLRQVTHFTDFDISWPAIGPADIVFQAGGRLYLLDLSSEEQREVKVNVVTDLASLRPRRQSVGDNIQSAHISPSGARAVFQARGEIFTVPAEHGVVRRLGDGSASAERYPAWSPDGKSIAYWSDASGEYELLLKPADGKGEGRTLTSLGAGYRYRPFWSLDSKKIAFIDHTQTIKVLDVESGQLTEVDRGLYWLHSTLQGFEVSWSSDSRWLAYSRDLETGNAAIFLFDVDSGERYQVTSGYYSDHEPAFDPEGKYLYYFSDRDLAPIYSDLDATWIYPNTTRLVAVPLRKDVASPLAPRSDEESAADRDEERSASDREAGEEDTSDTKGGGVDIDIDDFELRAVLLPAARGNYSTLRAASGKLIYRRQPRTGSADENAAIVYWDLKERKEETILDDAGAYELSADGKKILTVQRRRWAIIDVKPNQKIDETLATGKLEMAIEPSAEWNQLFTEVWRTYRDYFYDPNLHGLDWHELRRHYGSLLQDAVTRWDVNFIIGELIGEVNASHTYVFGGDTETPSRRQVGLLGIDWALENGAFRVDRIVRGAAWDAESRSPLLESGVGVTEDDYILAVNGVPLDTARSPHAAFEGLAGETVALTVNDRPTLEGARQVLVETLPSESRLRNLEWIEGNRRRVAEATDGRVGYIYVINTGTSGQTELVRQFNSQMTKDGLIIDERFNGGGQLPDRFIEKMDRQMVSILFFRHARNRTWPPVTHYGPKAMLINGWAGSGGDAFPWFFREMEVGPLIGERTWGGLIGPASGHQLIDGGFFTAPPGRLYTTRGEWFAEGHGVEPDIPVVDDPGEMAKGHDPQLEAAIAEVMRLIEENPPRVPEPPPFERRVPERRATENGDGS